MKAYDDEGAPRTAPHRDAQPCSANTAANIEADISIVSEINEAAYNAFAAGLAQRNDKRKLTLELTTPGGDADIARRIMLDIDLLRSEGVALQFLGKTTVYSAGVTIMSAFRRNERYLTDDCLLLIHGRQLEKHVELSGSLRSSLPVVQALIKQIELGIELEEAGFRRLVEDCAIDLATLQERAAHDWYLTAKEACELKLVRQILASGAPQGSTLGNASGEHSC